MGKNILYVVRGVQVMLDVELAEIYGYSTTAFNQQVKNNAEKFEGDDFCFYLTSDEYRNLISINLTSSGTVLVIFQMPSSKDAGKKLAAITEFSQGDVKKAMHDVITGMLGNPDLTLT